MNPCIEIVSESTNATTEEKTAMTHITRLTAIFACHEEIYCLKVQKLPGGHFVHPLFCLEEEL